MALAFFHGGQLAKGMQIYEEEGEGEGSQRVQSLRRLYSETALRERTRSENGSHTSRAPSRPRTSHRTDAARARFTDNIATPGDGRPSTARHPQTSGSPEPPVPTSKSTSKTFLGIPKPNFLSLSRPGPPKEVVVPTTIPSATDKRSWKQKQAARKDVQAPSIREAPPSPRRGMFSRASKTSPSQQDQQHSTEPPPARVKPVQVRVDTPVAAQSAENPAQFLAESLAHVIVGEWMFKDPHKPGILPQSNILQRHTGPPPRGATGVPQRRWFRIDPYERLLTWTSKWDTVDTVQHKTSRRGMHYSSLNSQQC
jgi:hypothetical protein